MWRKEWERASGIVFDGHPRVEFLQQCLVNSGNEVRPLGCETQTWAGFG